jgi:hypothetical protein
MSLLQSIQVISAMMRSTCDSEASDASGRADLVPEARRALAVDFVLHAESFDADIALDPAPQLA